MKSLVVALALTLCVAGMAPAQDQGGHLVIKRERYEFQPLDSSIAEILNSFSQFTAQSPMSESSSFFCVDDFCGCVGNFDCYLMIRAGVCSGDLSCGTLSNGSEGCHCTSRNPSVESGGDPEIIFE